MIKISRTNPLVPVQWHKLRTSPWYSITIQLIENREDQMEVAGNLLKSLFDEAISYWPEKIQIREKALFADGGAKIPALTAIHDEIEEKINNLKDGYLLLQMDWAIYTVLHKEARICEELLTRNVDVDDVFRIFQVNVRKEDEEE